MEFICQHVWLVHHPWVQKIQSSLSYPSIMLTVQLLITSWCSVCTCWSGLSIFWPNSLKPHLLCISYDSSSVSVSQKYEGRVFRYDLARADFKHRELMSSRIQRGHPSMGRQTSQYQRHLAHRRWWLYTVNAPFSVILRIWEKAWSFQGPGRGMFPSLNWSKYGPSITLSLRESKPHLLIPWK